MAGIFISYRRGDASGYAGRLRESLDRRLGTGQVFRDADAIEPGQDFVQIIETRVGDCSALLALIGQEWLNAKDAAGHRRLDLPGDFVTLEIAGALKRPDVLIVPVLVEGARVPGADDLPEPIRAMAHRQAVTLRDETWDEDVGRLAAVLVKRLGGATRLVHEKPQAGESAATQRASAPVRTLLVVGLVIALGVAAMFVSRFRKDIEPAAAAPSRAASNATDATVRTEPSTAATTTAYGIDIPRVSEFADGSLIHTLISGSVTPRGKMSLVRLRFRFSNDGPYPANFWDRSYRLVVGDQTLAPNSGLDEVVDAHALKEGIVSFEVPARTGKVTLRVESQTDPPGALALDLSPTGRDATPEGAPAGNALLHAVVTRLVQRETSLVSNRAVSYTLMTGTSRRFVNTLRVIFAIRMTNGDTYPRLFGSSSVRVLVDGLPTAPIDGPNEAVASTSSSTPRDFVFDVPTSTERLVLRTTLDDRVSEAPINLQSPSR